MTAAAVSMALLWSIPAATASAASPAPAAKARPAATAPSGSEPEGTVRRPAIARRASLQPRAGVAPQPATINSASAVTNISVSPLTLIPSPFVTTTHDYVIRCAAGNNSVTVTVSSVQPDQVVPLTLVENQPVVVQEQQPGGSQFWIRCLPHDFPALTVSRPGTPTPGYYLTSSLNPPSGSSPFAMILDTNGTPVWYTQTATTVHNVQLLPGTHTLAYGSLTGGAFGTDPYGAYQLYNLDSQTVSLVSTPIPPMDAHEFVLMGNGDRLMLASPLRAVPDTLPSAAAGTIIDCIVEEVDPNGKLVWSWDAYDHVAPSENVIGNVTTYPTAPPQPAADYYHCNSVDVDPSNSTASGDLLLSMRSDNAVVRINRSVPSNQPDITWKLGGIGPTKDGAAQLTIAGDDETSIYGQHDARFQAAGDISMYDDHTGQVASGAARGVEYNVTGTTATMVKEFKAVDGKVAAATGSFRRFSDGESVIGWGFKGGPTFSEVNAAGVDQLDVSMPPGQFVYRALKVLATDVDAGLLPTLRRTAGNQPFTPRSGVVLDGSGGLHTYGPDQVNISGAASWPGWDIARGVATRTDGSGGYTLDGYGGLSPFGTAPAVSSFPYAYWAGWDIARGIALCADGKTGFVADGWGGVHGFGGVPDPASADTFPGWDIVRGIVVTPDCKGGYTLDGYGGIHPYGNATAVTGSPYAYFGFDIARSIILRPDGKSGFVLDGWGGVHGFGGATDPAATAYWPGWDIARTMDFAGDAQSGYVVDGYGALHQFGAAAPGTGSYYSSPQVTIRGSSGS